MNAEDQARQCVPELLRGLEADLRRLEGKTPAYVACNCTVLLRLDEPISLGIDVHDWRAAPLSDFLSIHRAPDFQGAVDLAFCRGIAGILGVRVAPVADLLEAADVPVNRGRSPFP